MSRTEIQPFYVLSKTTHESTRVCRVFICRVNNGRIAVNVKKFSLGTSLLYNALNVPLHHECMKTRHLHQSIILKLS